MTPWSIKVGWSPSESALKYELQFRKLLTVDQLNIEEKFAAIDTRFMDENALLEHNAQIEELKRYQYSEWTTCSDSLEDSEMEIGFKDWGVRPDFHYIFRCRFFVKGRNVWTSWDDSEISQVITTPNDVPGIF